MEALLYKNSIMYMGGASGPGVYRKLIIPDLNVEIKEGNKISDIMSPDTIIPNTGEIIFKYPSELIHFSEEASNDLKELKKYYDALTQAQQNLKNATDNFKNTKGGKEIQYHLNPSQKLSIRDLLTEEDEVSIKNELAEKFSCKILKFNPKLEGYSNVEIDIELDKDHSLTIDKMKDLNIRGFVGSCSYLYSQKSGIIEELTLVKKDGQAYPPHVFSDQIELYEIEKQRYIATEKYMEQKE